MVRPDSQQLLNYSSRTRLTNYKLEYGLGEGLSKQTFGETAEQVQLGYPGQGLDNRCEGGNEVSHCQ